MRFRLANPASLNYLGPEPWLNNLKLVSINSATELALGVALVDSNGNFVDPTNAATSCGDGIKTVTTAATRVQFTSQACRYVILTGRSTNTKEVVLGGSTVVALAASRQGFTLFPSQNITLPITNMNLLYMDSLVNGEGVEFAWFA